MKTRLSIFSALVMLVAIGIAALCLWNPPTHVTRLEEPMPSASAPPAPAPTGPPCIHQLCAQRPAFLNCASEAVNGQFSTRYCARWEIQYEHHCDCDAWGPAP